MTELLVTYPAGSTAECSAVAAVTKAGGEVLFAVERTPCHPESPRWPDQPSDRCTLELIHAQPSRQTPVECHEGYLLGDRLGLGDPPEGSNPSENSAEAIRCVVHRAPGDLALAVGEEVLLRVEEPYRMSLSRSHSRCHLVSLALNAALRDAWRKDPGARDSLGNPDFDKLTIVSSKIDQHGSVDIYRVGKHLRKAGFPVEALSDTDALANAVAGIARKWLQSSPEISVTPGTCRLEERRTWSCLLPDGTASFPCGGTHTSRIGPDDGLAVAISWDPQERRVTMTAEGGSFHV